MTDKELIAEARKCAPGDDPTGLAVMVHRLVDVLEATRGERDAAVAAIERVRAIHRSEPTNGYNGQVRYECLACGITSPCPTIMAVEGDK